MELDQGKEEESALEMAEELAEELARELAQLSVLRSVSGWAKGSAQALAPP